jgi:Trk K+ transport system NAD-binding subunit
VYLDCEFDGKMIKDLDLPDQCLLVGVKRGEKEIIPKGDTCIYSGDYLIVLADEELAGYVNEQLLELCTKPTMQ